MRVLSKEELIKRLEFILKVYKPDQRGMDLKVLFDDDIWIMWENGQLFSERFRNLDISPHDVFVIRKSMISKIKNSKLKEFDEEAVKKVFEEGDDLVIDQFKKSGSEDDIVSKTNIWYFCSYGTEVFDTKSGRKVPSRISTDEIFEKANAHYLHKQLREKKIKTEKIIILKLANGKKSLQHIAFMDEFRRLDKKYSTGFYSNLKCIITDISEKMIDEARQIIAKTGKHQDKLEFKKFDILKDTMNEKLAVIDSSYLFDSISQPFIAKIVDKYYEVYIRGVIDDSFRIRTKNNKKISAEKFKDMLINNRFYEIKKLATESFNAIQIERKLVEINIKNYPYAEIIEALYGDIPFALIPADLNLIESLRKLGSSLAEGGYMHAFEYGLKSMQEAAATRKGYVRYNGNITTPINFPLIEMLEPQLKLKLEITTSLNNLSIALNQRIISIDSITRKLEDHDSFKRVYGYSLNRHLKLLQEIENKVLKEYGYCEKGLRKFVKELNKHGMLNWKKHKWLELHYRNKSYTFDYFESMFLYLKYNVSKKLNKKLLWLIENSDNKTYLDIVSKMGYTQELLSHIFNLMGELSSKESYILLRATKTDYKKKIIPKEKKEEVNLDKIQELLLGESKIVEGIR